MRYAIWIVLVGIYLAGGVVSFYLTGRTLEDGSGDRWLPPWVVASAAGVLWPGVVATLLICPWLRPWNRRDHP